MKLPKNSLAKSHAFAHKRTWAGQCLLAATRAWRYTVAFQKDVKKLMPIVAISTFPNVTKVFEEFRERMLGVWFAVQQQSFSLICFVCMARVFCFCEEMLVLASMRLELEASRRT